MLNTKYFFNYLIFPEVSCLGCCDAP